MKNKILNQLVNLSLISAALALPVQAATITENRSYVEGAVSAMGNGSTVFESADDFASNYYFDSAFNSYSDAYFYGGLFPETYNSAGQPIVIDATGSAGGVQNSVYGVDHFVNGTDRIYATGSSYAQVSDPDNALSSIDMTGRSVVDITFTLASDHTYSLTGGLFSDALGRSVLHFNGDTANQGDNFSYNGFLAAGEYSLFVEAFSGIDSATSTTSSFDFDLQLTAVPVPAAVWLFASGLVGLAGFARRKNA